MQKLGKVRPLFDRILIKKVEAVKKTSGGILLPEAKGATNRFGVVVAVGEGRANENGKIILNSLKEGQTVLLPEYGGSKVPGDKNDGDELYLYSESDILAVVSLDENKKI